MVRRIVLSTLCCAVVVNICAMEKYDVDRWIVGNVFTTTYISPSITKSLQQSAKDVATIDSSLKTFMNFCPRPGIFVPKKNQTIACSPDNTKVAVAGSYRLSHMLNCWDTYYYLNIFDVAAKKCIYRLHCYEKPIVHLRFVNDHLMRAYYKGSEYVGSDTVQEWNLDVGLSSVQIALIEKLLTYKGEKLSEVDRYSYIQLPKAVQELLIEEGVCVAGDIEKKWNRTLGLIN